MNPQPDKTDPAGRAPCAGRGHFVTCAGLRVGAPDGRKQTSCRPSGGQREALKRRVNARPTRSGPVRQDIVSGESRMNYPFWEVPWLGSSSVIAIIAVFHVMISQFAVGGGLFLPIAERKALREGRPKNPTGLINSRSTPASSSSSPASSAPSAESASGSPSASPSPKPPVPSSTISSSAGPSSGSSSWSNSPHRRLLLHLGPHPRKSSTSPSAGSTLSPRLHAGHHQRHPHLHAHPRRHLARRRRHRPRSQ